MKGLEQAIRKALAKGDAEDEAFRQRVYQSAFAALERALNARADLAPEAIEARRDRLRSRIASIESEFAPALPEIDPDDRWGPGEAVRPPRFDYDDDFAPPEPAPRTTRRRRRPLRLVLIAAALLFVLVIGAVWWSLQIGLFLSPSSREAGSGDQPGPAQTVQQERAAVEDWITVFDPDEPAAVAVPAGSVAEIVEDDGVAYLRMRGEGAEPIRFDVGAGTLERLAGRTALFSLVARAAEPTQIAVACDFGALGECGRKRFEISPATGEFLFEVEIPAGRPTDSGTILIHPDVEGSGAPVELREIRVAIAG